MTTRRAQDVRAALASKGFQETTTDHWRYFLLYKNKKTAINTKVSFGQRELDKGLLAMMARQVKLSKGQFLDLVDCPLTADAYIETLIKNGSLKRPKEDE